MLSDWGKPTFNTISARADFAARRPDVLEEDGDAPPPPREASPARLAHGSKLRRGKRRRLPAVRSPGYYVKLPAASAGV